MKPRSACRIAFLARLTFLAAATASAYTSLADEPTTDMETPLLFRRIYAPSDRVDQWLRERGLQYHPVDPSEFERLVDTASSTKSGEGSQAAVRLVEARFSARLAGQDLVDGLALLHVVHAVESPSLLPLAPWGLALEDAHWEGPEPLPATVGITPEGAPAVLVERSGRLRLNWSLQGHQEPGRPLELSLAFPSAPLSSLDVIASPTLAIQPGTGAWEVDDLPDATRRWHIELGGRGHIRLQVAEARSSDRPDRPPLVRQESTYDLSPRGLQLAVRLEIDADHAPLERVELSLDPDLRLVAVRHGDAPVPWSQAPAAPGQPSRVVVELPEPLVGSGKTIQLAAFGPAPVGSRWQLPLIRPQGLFWQEGKLVLRVPAPLELVDLEVRGCRQSRAGSLPGDLPGESIELEEFEPNSRVEVVLAEQSHPLRVECGTTVRLGGASTTGRFVAALSLEEGQRFAVDAQVASQWTIDAVTTDPPEALADWEVRTLDADYQALHVELDQAVSASNPVRLLVSGRRLHSPVGEQLALADLQFLDILAADPVEQLVHVEATNPYQIKLSGVDRLVRLDPGRLSAARALLFEEPPRGLLFLANADAAQLAVSVERQAPQYSADIEAEATLQPGTLRESYVIHCVPQSLPLERLLVRFSEPRSTNLQWTLGSDSQPLAARRLAGRTQAAISGNSTTEGESWEVNLPTPEQSPFELRAVRATPFDGRAAVSLASVPLAAEQRGELAVQAIDGLPFQVQDQGLSPMAAAPLAPGAPTRQRAAYRYDPSTDQEDGSHLIVSRVSPESAPPSALLWDLRLDSCVEPRGPTRHEVLLRIENAGLTRFSLQLPAAAAVERLSIDGAPAGPRWEGGRLLVPLPAERRFVAVGLHFTTPGSAHRLWDALDWPLPEADLPTLYRQWTVWAPPDRRIYPAADGWEGAPISTASWCQRLFGPLARKSNAQPFDPLSADDWRSLLIGTAAVADGAQQSIATDGGPTVLAAPWGGTGADGFEPMDKPGWTATRFQGDPPPDGRVWIVAADLPWVLGWAVFLGIASVSWPGPSRRVRAQVSWLLGCSLVALAVPAWLVPVTSCAVLASLVTLAVGMARLVTRAAPERPSQRAHRSLSAPVALVLIAALIAARPTAAEEDNARQTDIDAAALGTATVHDVVIPVDDPLKPENPRYYLVHEQFLQQLERRAAAATRQPQGWLVERASYRAVLAWEVLQRKLGVAELKAGFDILVFGRKVRVRMPLGGVGVEGVADHVFVDGGAVPATWEKDGCVLAFDVVEPGPCRVEVSLRPAVHAREGASGFSFQVPPIPRATLELIVPPEAPAATVVSGTGAVLVSQGGQRTLAQLGPTSRLAVEWQEGAPRSAATAPPDVEELLWLKVQPGSVVLDARLRVTLADGGGRKLRLAIDPRLRLLPLPPATLATAKVQITPDDPHILELELAPSVARQIVVPLSLLWTGSSGLGQFRLPTIELLQARSVRRVLAVSVDPNSLESHELGTERLEALAAPDFLARWGAAPSAPQAAWVLPADDGAWQLATWPLPTRATASEDLIVTCGSGEALLRLEANLEALGPPRFQHRFEVPPDLDVQSVSVHEGGALRPSRWSRVDRDGIVTVFLEEPAAAPQLISLTGRLEIPTPGDFPLPHVEILDAEVRLARVRVCRMPSVQVTVRDLNDLAPIPADEVGPPDVTERLVGAFARQSQDASAKLRVTANAPRVEAALATALKREGIGLWTAETQVHLGVEDGLLDELRLEAPRAWTGPFQVEPAAAVEVFDLPGEERRQLVIRPPVAVEADATLLVRGRWQVAPGSRVRAPAITALGCRITDQWLLLPTQAGSQDLSWETSGLRRAPVAESFPLAGLAPDTYFSYQAIATPYSAVVRQAESAVGRPSVRLADVRLVCQPHGEAWGLASFDVLPEGAAQTPLWMPSEARLARVMVGGRVAAPLPAGPNRWQLDLGPRQWPQRIEVVFLWPRPAKPAERGGCEFAAPRLGDWPVERTLWTIFGPGGATRVELASGQPLTALAAEQERLAGVAALFDAASTAVTEAPPEDSLRWFEDWRSRAAASQTAARSLATLERDAALRASAEVEREAFDQKVLALAERLGLEAAPPPNEAANEAAALDSILLERRLAVQRIALPGRAATLAVRFPQAAAESVGGRIAIATLLVLGLALVFLAAGRPIAWHKLVRWLPAFGVAAGLFWWLWLAPSAAGWLIIAASLAAALRLPRPGRSESGSSIVEIRVPRR